MVASLKVATDFSGLGSPEEALKRLQVEHEVVFACDKDKYAKAAYLANHNPGIFYDDITTRNHAEAPQSDIYIFGFPCQAFSLAGNRKGFEDTRGTLVYNSAEYIRTHRPRVFVAENVKGLLSHDKPKGSKSKFGRTFGVIRDLFGCTVNGQQNLYKYKDCLDYHIFFQVLNSKDYTVPQNRERVFIVGFRDEKDANTFSFPKKIPLIKRLKDLLEDIVDDKYNLSDKMLKWLIMHSHKNKEKGNGFNFNPTEGEDIAACINSRVHKMGVDDNYIKVPIDSSILFIKENTAKGYAEADLFDSVNYSNPTSKTRRGRVGKQIANTLDTACNQAVIVPIQLNLSLESAGVQPYMQNRVYDPDAISPSLTVEAAHTLNVFYNYIIRRLTPKECFRLQGYSDEFFEKCALVNSDTQLYIRAGNSITVDTIMHLLIQILKAINIPYKLAA